MFYTKPVAIIGLTALISGLYGCSSSSTQPAETAELNVWNEPMNCVTGANYIDGKQVAGTLCATRDFGAYSGKTTEPQIYFSPNNEQAIQKSASDAADGTLSQWKGNQVLLKCDETLGADYKTVVNRLCRVSINNQPLVSAHINYVRGNEDLEP
ncbi:hypothetical protein [Pseudomonas sp. 5P_3.1_Bac2]|uniref:hypothetical protein n=1 Tax=Pseudomonas sp. 5P_3.1_Bac2 TaxID=2971617 RepID=UPI0021CA43EA|nr:hypothetical protein [Pseudomonas sp. 5P_3.1_Bac2]MCU1717199.1 hypothetical protein [Pseudomonas sp. 5P_3.1_Bac2]